MVRRVREGFGDERGGRRGGTAARGNLRLDELTAADRSSRKEARRLGLLNSDEEWSEDERENGQEDKGGEEELDEQTLGEMLAREQRARHMGLSQTAQEYLDYSDSEGEEVGDGSGEVGRGRGDGEGAGGGGGEEEEEERREEERIQRQWVKRTKRRRVLAEVEQAGAGDSQGPERLLEEDDDSQAILSLLQCTNSRGGASLLRSSSGVGYDGSSNGGGSRSISSGLAGKRGVPQGCTGEFDNSGQAAKSLGAGKVAYIPSRSRSSGSRGHDSGAAVRGFGEVERAFSLPQLVTRSHQMQRKGSFLSRVSSSSKISRSGSLAASGKATVSASKFIFVSAGAGEDTGATRSGFEQPLSREQGGQGGGSEGSAVGGPGGSRGGGDVPWGNNSRAGGAGGDARKAGAGVGGGQGDWDAAGGGMGRLWKGLCANKKAKNK
ncbi:unnamed protein product [Discosporangium mesarthrocarpum]